VRKLATAIALFFAVITPRLSFADEPTPPLQECGNTAFGEIIYCSVAKDGTIVRFVSSGGNSAPKRETTGGATTTVKYVTYTRLTSDADGKPCITTGYVEAGVVPSDLAPDSNQNHTEINGGNNLTGSYPPCPQQNGSPGELGPVLTQAIVAAQAWAQRVTLPKPRPSIAPGRALTGKLAYLETNGRLSLTYTEDTIFGPLVIDAHGSYTVAWGDGVTTGPHAFEGQPWPDGRITHEYINVGSYNIVVTEKWTATWSLDGDSGVLRSLQTTGTINNFPVEQLQAVIGR